MTRKIIRKHYLTRYRKHEKNLDQFCLYENIKYRMASYSQLAIYESNYAP